MRSSGRVHGRGAGTAGFGIGVIVVALYATVAMYAATSLSYDVAGGFLVFPVLVAITVPLLVRISRRDVAVSLRILVTALVLKLLSALARYYMSYGLYESGADGERYHDSGILIAQALHDGLPWTTTLPAPGTGTMEIITGYLYWVIGPTRVGGFFVYAWFGFLGLLLFTRAFRIGLPEGNLRRYSLLVLFLPSLLFWPSSIGKEAWMTLCLGGAAYGAACLLQRRWTGVPLLALGLYGMIVVRPHMAVLIAAGLVAGFLVRPVKRGSTFGPLTKLVGLVLVVAMAGLLVTRAETFFGVSGEGGGESVTQILDKTQEQTSEGGSAFEATPVRSPVDLPMATISVLLRPFPYEAHNIQALVASLESLLLLFFLWRFRRSLTSLPGALRRNPYVAFVTTYTLLFIVAFSSFANFGILTRQRVQVFPFVLVLLALPEAARRARRTPYVPSRRAVVTGPASGAATTRPPMSADEALVPVAPNGAPALG